MKKIQVVCCFIFLCLVCSTVSFAADTIKIGALFSVTGPASFLGAPMRNTAQMVVDEVNKAGGVKGRKLELIVYDTAGDATKAVQLVSKLIKSDHVVAIIGPNTSGEAMAVIPIVEKEHIPLVTCAASIKITEPVKKWVFKTTNNDTLAVMRIYEYLQKVKQTNVALLTVSDGFGASGREQLKAQAQKHGIKIVSDDTYGPKDTDMTAQLTKIRGSQAQAVICWGTNPGPAIVARNAHQLGIKMPLFMSHGVSSKKFIELAGDAAEGLRLPASKVLVADALPNSDLQKKTLLGFIKDYQKHFKVDADTFSGHAWDAIMVVTNAIEKGGDSPAAIRDQIEKSRNFAGISGVFNFSGNDHAGLTKDSFVMVEIKNKDWVLLK
ncbi:ABC transporter substrate-binding protein [Geobacter argillaceus]|nr:ABC transporter substrate-binding protein [Geobacter argillaceus]